MKRLYDLENKEEVSILDYDDSVYVKTDYKTVRVEVSSIIYIEGMSEYVKIITENQKDPVIALLSMKKLEEKLPGNRFLRVHKSFIINLSKITQVSKGHVRMQDGSSIPIGESYRDSLLSSIANRWLNRVRTQSRRGTLCGPGGSRTLHSRDPESSLRLPLNPKSPRS